MQRNIHIEGEMGALFGAQHHMNAPTVRDVFKLMQVNHPGFKKYLIDSHEKGISFAIEVGGEDVEYAEELLLPLHKGDVLITPVPEGAGGNKKILAALAIFAVVIATGGFAGGGAFGQGLGAGGMGPATATAGLNLAGKVAMMISVNLAMTGLGEVMAPDPSTDSDQEESYLFNGQEQNLIEGDPVPILYGKLEVPGQPINFEISNLSKRSNGVGPFQQGARGDIITEEAIRDRLDIIDGGGFDV